MFKYLWIVILVLITVIWSILSLRDIIYCIKEFKMFWFDNIEGYTVLFITAVIAALFFGSVISFAIFYDVQ